MVSRLCELGAQHPRRAAARRVAFVAAAVMLRARASQDCRVPPHPERERPGAGADLALSAVCRVALFAGWLGLRV